MSFLDSAAHSSLLDCSDQEGSMKASAWGGADLLDPGGDASDFDISSFFNQLTSSTAPVEPPHGPEGLCAPDVSSDALTAPPDDDQLCAANEEPNAADVSLSALLGEHAELQEAFLAAAEPAPASGKTFVVVKKEQQRTEGRCGRGRRRRTTPPYGRPPEAPLSAYNLFVKEQYPKLKAKWRGLNVRRSVPKLALMWSRMGRGEKEVYQRRAEEGKIRYRTLLDEYRQRARLWRRYQGADTEGSPDDPLSLTAEVHSDDDQADLFCSLCNIYCSSSHNKEQHLHGRQHVRNMTTQAAEEEAASRRPPSPAGPPEESSEAADVQDSLESVFLAVSRREREVQFLTEFSAGLSRQQQQLHQQLTELEARRAAAAADQQAVASQHRQLTEHVQNLLLVPTLFGVMSEWSRDAQRTSAISERRGELEV